MATGSIVRPAPPESLAPGAFSNILAIRFARLGDVALLLPSLARLKVRFPGARLTLITGSRCAALAGLCPALDEVISVDRLAMRDGPKLRAIRDMAGVVRDVRRRRFDLVVDFHSFRETNLLAWLSRARYRLGMRRSDRAYLPFCFNLPPALEDKSLHVADMFQRVVDHVPGGLRSPADPPPPIVVPAEVDEFVRGLDPAPAGARSGAIYVGASVADRRWPAERFHAVARHLSGTWGWRVWILAGNSASEVAIAEQIGRGLDPARVRVLRGLDIPRLAGVIAAADLLISNDTGPMHLGPATGTPTLGIFSRSLPVHYRPLGPVDLYVRKETVQQIEVEDVLEAMEAIRAATAGRDRRP